VKIFAFINEVRGPAWMIGNALTEDGRIVVTHVSSSPDWAKHDLGVTSDWHHDDYREACPNGFEVEWVDDPTAHAGFRDALAELNRRNAQAI
jgi:hypothetical protein